MYTLYFSPGSCSLVVHCLLEELGVPFELKRVDANAKDDYRKLNPKGKVPAIAGPDGVLTECVAIVEYLCDRHDAQRRWLAAPGTWQRAKTLEQIATLATEIHPVFNRYFFMVMARWGRWLDPPANEMRNIRPFYERMIARPAVARAFATEGIKAFGTT